MVCDCNCCVALSNGAVGSSAVCTYDYTSLDVTSILLKARFYLIH